MASQTKCVDTPRVIVAGVYRPDLAARLAAHEGIRLPPDIDLEDVDDEMEQAVWTEQFRNGTAAMDLCGGCGRPLGIHLSLAEWLSEPLVCRHCRYDLR